VSENDVVVEAWNSVLFEKFTRFKHLLIAGLASYSDAVFARGLYPAGARVLDVGCGFGDSAQRLASAVGPTGHAVGVDCAERLRGPYDHIFARFGTMFFMNPGAAALGPSQWRGRTW